LAKTYRAIHQWDHWLQHALGRSVLDAEQEILFSLLEQRYGKHAVLLGSPQQQRLLNASVMPHYVLISPLINKDHAIASIESGFYELPIASGCVDLVLLPHTLELLDNPQQLLMEACRIVKPEGHIIIFGFNSFSLWGLKKRWMQGKHMSWPGNFIQINTIKKWLALSDFQLTKQTMLLFRPPMQHASFYKKLKYIEWVGQKFLSSFGGAYMIMAQAKTIPLTPIKLRWQQQLSGMHASIPRPTIRISQ